MFLLNQHIPDEVRLQPERFAESLTVQALRRESRGFRWFWAILSLFSEDLSANSGVSVDLQLYPVARSLALDWNACNIYRCGSALS